ncbi:hypothetical protein SAMN06298215_0795 [Bacteroidales bacterium WCE2008]|nr:hypothetical protein SAMN06298215_0795 [Bacteroidales bacterium WCE2008]
MTDNRFISDTKIAKNIFLLNLKREFGDLTSVLGVMACAETAGPLLLLPSY